MNNTNNLNPRENPNTPTGLEEQSDPSQTLELLQNSTSENIEGLLDDPDGLQTLNIQSEKLKTDIEELNASINPISQKVEQEFSQNFPDLNQDQLNWIQIYFLKFKDANKIKNNIIQTKAFPEIDENLLEETIQNLLDDEDIKTLPELYTKLTQKEKEIQDAISSLNQGIEDLKTLDYLVKKFTEETGIHFNNNLKAYCTVKTINAEGETEDLTMTVIQSKLVQNQAVFKVKYVDPITVDEVEKVFTSEQLKNLLFHGQALNMEINSPKDINHYLDLDRLGLNITKNSLDYVNSDNQVSRIQVVQKFKQKIELSEEVFINSEKKSTLTLAEFLKWATLHKAMPTLNHDQLQEATSKLPDLISSKTSYPREDISNYNIQVGSSFNSPIDQLPITITSLDSDQITYNYGPDLQLKATNSMFLRTLMKGLYIPVLPALAQEDSSDSNDTNEERDGSLPPNQDLPQDNDQPPETEDQSSESSKKNVQQYEFGSPPNPLDISTWTGLIGKVLTFNGHITYLSYTDWSETLIPKIVDNIRTSLKNKSQLKMGKNFKNLPLIGDDMADIESAAKREQVEAAKSVLDRIGNWRKVQDIICSTDDIFQFIAATNFLKDKGYLPTYNERYLQNVNRLAGNLGMPTFDIPDDIQANRSIIDKYLIDFYDSLLDPGDGIRMINSNKSNEESSIQEYKRQSSEIFSQNPNWGLTKLHSILTDYRAGKEIDPHEYKGYLLGAYDSGEVGEVELLTYFVLGNTIKDSNGDTLVKGYEALVASLKKEFIGFNLLLDQNLEELSSFFDKNILVSGAIPEPTGGGSASTLEQRFGAKKAEMITNYVYFTNLSVKVTKKQNEYLKDRALKKEHAGYSIFSQDFSSLYKDFAFIPPTSSSALTTEQVVQSFKTFPQVLKAYSDVAKAGESEYINDPSKFAGYKGRIKNSLMSYILIEGAYTDRVQPRKGSKAGGDINDQEKKGTKSKREQSRKFITEVLVDCLGPSQEDSINQLFKAYSKENDKHHETFYQDITSIFQQIDPDKLFESLKRHSIG